VKFKISPDRVISHWVPGVKRPGSEANHSPPINAEVKKTLIHTCTPAILLHGIAFDQLSAGTALVLQTTRVRCPLKGVRSTSSARCKSFTRDECLFSDVFTTGVVQEREATVYLYAVLKRQI
jgi:hypothetical protein